jgi:hypothetical protein
MRRVYRPPLHTPSDSKIIGYPSRTQTSVSPPLITRVSTSSRTRLACRTASRRIGALVKDLRWEREFSQRWHEFDQFRREMFSRQHPPLGIVVLPGAAHISRVHGGTKRVKIVLWGNRRVGPECADDCDKSLASAFLNLTQSQIWHETVSNA